ncbi:MAG: metal-dependent hydrolase [bacterium]|nr:metal-dependent hydrolase [bacterium]
MDTPTHGLIGRVIAKTIWPEQSGRGLVNLVTICSVLPDADTLISSDGLDYLRTHRGFTHSFLGVVVGSLLVAGLAKRFGFRNVSFGHLYLVSLLGMVSHIVFDLVTTYGTLILAPFSDYRAAFDLLFIIDPYLDVILIGGLIAGWRVGKQGYRWGGMLLSGYMVLAILVTGLGHVQVRRWAAREGVTVARASVMPSPFSPLHRRGMVESGDKIYLVPLNLFSGAYGTPVAFGSALKDPRLGELWQTRTGEIYAWFTRYPVVQAFPGEEKTALLIQDLQFMVRKEGLGFLGMWAAEAAVNLSPDFFDRRIFYLKVDLNEASGIGDVHYFRGG